MYLLLISGHISLEGSECSECADDYYNFPACDECAPGFHNFPICRDDSIGRSR